MPLARLLALVAPPLCVGCGAPLPRSRAALCAPVAGGCCWLGSDQVPGTGVRDLGAGQPTRVRRGRSCERSSSAGRVRLVAAMAAQIAANAPPALLTGVTLVPVPLHRVAAAGAATTRPRSWPARWPPAPGCRWRTASSAPGARADAGGSRPQRAAHRARRAASACAAARRRRCAARAGGRRRSPPAPRSPRAPLRSARPGAGRCGRSRMRARPGDERAGTRPVRAVPSSYGDGDQRRADAHRGQGAQRCGRRRASGAHREAVREDRQAGLSARRDGVELSEERNPSIQESRSPRPRCA